MKSSFRFGCPAISRWYKDITSGKCLHDVMLSLHFNVLNEEQTVRQWNLQVHGSQHDRMVWVACGQNFSWVLHEVDFNPWKASTTHGHRYWSDWCRLATLLCQGQVNICRTTCSRVPDDMWHGSIERTSCCQVCTQRGSDIQQTRDVTGPLHSRRRHAMSQHIPIPQTSNIHITTTNCKLLSFALSLCICELPLQQCSSSASVLGSAFWGDPGSLKHFKQLTQVPEPPGFISKGHS